MPLKLLGELGLQLCVRMRNKQISKNKSDGAEVRSKVWRLKNRVAVLSWDKNRAVDWDGVKVLECETAYWKRRALEAIWIREVKNSNLDCDSSLFNRTHHHVTIIKIFKDYYFLWLFVQSQSADEDQ